MDEDILARVVVGARTVTAVQADLTRMMVDAIVNAANSHLLHGGGLAGAIVRCGGAIIQEESLRVAPVPGGSVAVTGAGTLPCRWVIHAVGPRWGEGDEERKLRSAVWAALDAAAGLGARSVAVPAISTGIFGYPKPAGTHDITDEALRWAREVPANAVHEIERVGEKLRAMMPWIAANRIVDKSRN